jgi:hypothetical protein
MHHPLADLFGQILVTGKTNVLHLLLEQRFESRRMEAVAGKTFSLGSRLMLHLFIKGITIVAGETIHPRTGRIPLMAVRTVARGKRGVFLRVKQILFRAAMGIMAGNARIGPRLDRLMGGEEVRLGLIMTFGAEFGDGPLGHKLMV